jgi:hypothetical protein
VKDVLLDRFYVVPSGSRIRLRLARPLDRDGLAALLGELGLATADFEVRRALRCHPGRRWAVVATSWDGTTERLVGFGALDRDGTTLLAGDRDLQQLLEQALDARARSHERRVA